MMQKKKKSLELKSIRIESTKFNPALSSCFGYCFFKAAIKMKYLLNEEFFAQGLILPQLGLMMLLKKLGPMSQIVLGRELDIDKATMVKLIDNLEDKKFVTRTPSKKDRRIKFLEITKLGIKKLEEMTELRLKIEKEFLRNLSASEKENLTKIIAKLV